MSFSGDAEFFECRGSTAESDGHAFVVGDHGKTVLPAEIAETLHLGRFPAEIDFAVDDPAPLEVRTKSIAVRTPICGKDQNRIERAHSSGSFVKNSS